VNSRINHTTINFALLGGLFIAFLVGAVLTEWYFLAVLPFVAVLLYNGWTNSYLVFFLLLLSLPFSFEYNFTPFFGSDIPDEGLMLFVSVLFAGYWVYDPGSLPLKTIQHPLLILLVAHLGWILVTTLFSSDLTLSIKFFLAKGWYMGAFVLAPLIVFREKKHIKAAAVIFAASMLAVAIIAMVNHLIYDFSFAAVSDAVAPFFRNHVNYSAMLVCALPVFVAIHQLNTSKRIKAITKTSIILLLVALFLSYARGAWLALLMGGLAYWLIKKRSLLTLYIAGIMITVSAIFWIKGNDRYLEFAHDHDTTVFHEDFQEHLIATYKLKDVSSAERFYRWVAAVRMIKYEWLTGYGPNTFYDNYRPYTIPAYKTWVSNNTEHSTVHNYFLLLAVEQGIPGLILFLLLLGAMLFYAQQLYHRAEDVFYKTVAIMTGVIIVMIVTVNMLSDLVETDKIGSLFFLCLSILVMTDINTKKSSQSPPDVQRIS
jgi:O-antigen ligase